MAVEKPPRPALPNRDAAFKIMAITGHQTSTEVTRYAKAASQRVRAASALELMQNESVPLLDTKGESGTNSPANILTINSKK